MDKRCGTCRWWGEVRISRGMKIGKCQWPIPYWIDTTVCGEGNGARCKAWEHIISNIKGSGTYKEAK